MQRIKKLIANAAVALMLLVPMAVPVTVSAQGIQDNLNLGTCLPDQAGCNEDQDASINDLIADVVNIFSLIVGAVAVIMIIVGGFRYITSGGNDSSVAGAKNTILYAIIGLVIVALAQFIVRFVLARVTD